MIIYLKRTERANRAEIAGMIWQCKDYFTQAMERSGAPWRQRASVTK
jgi:hypothetical protein